LRPLLIFAEAIMEFSGRVFHSTISGKKIKCIQFMKAVIKAIF
jgi:hypothetical protein